MKLLVLPAQGQPDRTNPSTWSWEMPVFCQCFKQELCFVELEVCLCLCCLFPLSLCAGKIVFLKTRVAAARDWGKPCICFVLFIHPLSAAVGAVGICLTLRCTYQLLDAWPKPTPTLWGHWPNLLASLCQGDLAVQPTPCCSSRHGCSQAGANEKAESTVAVRFLLPLADFY